MAEEAGVATNRSTQKPKQLFDGEPIMVGELLKRPYKPTEWLVEGLVPARAVTIIFGHPGVFKTRIVLDMLRVAADEKMWLGRFATRPTRALFIDEENTEDLIRNQLGELGFTGEPPIGVYSMQNVVISDEYMHAIVEVCKKHDFDAVVFDPMVYMLNGANENEAPAMAMLIKKLQIPTKAGITPILLHHSNKEGGFRGSTAIKGAIGSMLHVIATNNGIAIEQEKSRHGIAVPTFAIKVETSDDETYMRFRYDGAVAGEAKKTEEIDVLRQEMISALTPDRMLSQTELVAVLKASQPAIAINDKKLRDIVLPPMLESGAIDSKRIGGGKTIKYFLPKVDDGSTIASDDFAAKAQEAVESGNFTEMSIDDLLGD